MPAIERSEPPYRQLARYFRNEILAGRLGEGESLPPIREIARTSSVSHATAAKVVQQLKTEGLVTARAGAGTVVQRSELLHRSAQDRVTTVEATGRIYPAGHYAKILSAELISAPVNIAEVYGLDAGAPVIRRRRTTYDAADQPLSHSVSWYDGALASVAPALLETERVVQGTVQYVMECTARNDQTYYAEVMHAASSATAEEAAELGVTAGDPVERTRNFFRDDQGDLIEYGESTYRAELWSFYNTGPKGGL